MRQPILFFRKFTRTHYVKLSSRQIHLRADKAVAFEKDLELTANRSRATVSFVGVAPLFDKYLDWLHEHRPPATYDKARHYPTLFAQHLGCGFRVETLEPVNILLWVEVTDWNETTFT